jgi:predicted DNA-binding transcriptional regulator AlpA
MSHAGSGSVPQEGSRIWSVPECARFLGRSPRWVWSALRRRAEDPGSIPHVRIGRSPRFFPDDIAAWVRAGCPPAAAFAEWKAAEEGRRKSAS